MYALVKFKDGKRSCKYLVLTKDIRGYSPTCVGDFKDKEYDVKWQKSFSNDDDVHDGYYKAEILCVGGECVCAKSFLLCAYSNDLFFHFLFIIDLQLHQTKYALKRKN
jgi:hypothetical protein